MNYLSTLESKMRGKTLFYEAYFFGPTASVVAKKLGIPNGFKLTGKNDQEFWAVSRNKWKKIRKEGNITIVKIERPTVENDTRPDSETL